MRPGVEYHGDVYEAGRDYDISQIGNPQLIVSGWSKVLRQIGKDRVLVIALVVRTKRCSGRTWRPFDRFHFCDLAIKVGGVGSVGTFCAVALFTTRDDDPLFLQIEEARASVLESYAGKSRHPNHGRRVVVGQRLMPSASDVFLVWTQGKNRRDYYVRQLRDPKISPIIEGMDGNLLRAYGRFCGRGLARANARSGDAAMISGYLGSSDAFDDAICEFAVEYADQNQRDCRAFAKAVRDGRIKAAEEE